jgi:hypothetical protein
MFIAALFTIPNYGNNPDALQLMNLLWKCDIYKMKFYSAQLEDIMLSEVNQAQKDKDHMFFLICGR